MVEVHDTMPIRSIVLAVALFASARAVGAADVREFCTNAGPMSLTVDGATVTGTYRITVKTPADEGTIAGTLKDGLFEGTWTEPHSRGRLVIGFAADYSSLDAIYTSSVKPTEWVGQWHGVSRGRLATMKPEARKDLRCDWK
jgi:hypothetical protein